MEEKPMFVELEDAIRGVLLEAFNPPTTLHRRDALTGKCDITCQPCALERLRKAYVRWNSETSHMIKQLDELANSGAFDDPQRAMSEKASNDK